MNHDPKARSAIAAGLDWSVRLIAVGLLMFLPGLAGQQVDARFGTSFATLLGFVFGFVAALASLLFMVKR